MARRRMYQLPERMVGSPDDLSGGIKIELVEKYINKHKSFLPRYRYLENLYKGFHDIYKQPEKESWKPDNRLAVNFPRYIVDTFLGYSYGIPIKKTHDDGLQTHRTVPTDSCFSPQAIVQSFQNMLKFSQIEVFL